MNITSSSASLDQLWQSMQTSSTTSTSSAASTQSATSASGTADSTSLSDPGKLFKELQSLSQSDPAEFKKITSEIATQLQAAAKDSSDSGQSSFLSNMATNFENASESGSFSDLFPSNSGQSGSSATSSSSSTGQNSPAGPPPPPGYGESSSSSGASSTSSDPLSTIFSQALSQIQTDLASSTSSTV